jgi:hypothetical protein
MAMVDLPVLHPRPHESSSIVTILKSAETQRTRNPDESGGMSSSGSLPPKGFKDNRRIRRIVHLLLSALVQSDYVRPGFRLVIVKSSGRFHPRPILAAVYLNFQRLPIPRSQCDAESARICLAARRGDNFHERIIVSNRGG